MTYGEGDFHAGRTMLAEQHDYRQLDYERIDQIIKELHNLFMRMKKDHNDTRMISQNAEDTLEALNQFYTEVYPLMDGYERKAMDVDLDVLRVGVAKIHINSRYKRCPPALYMVMDKFFKELMVKRQEHGLGIPASIRKSTKDRITSAISGGKD